MLKKAVTLTTTIYMTNPNEGGRHDGTPETASLVTERTYTPLTPEEEAESGLFMSDIENEEAKKIQELIPEKLQKREYGPEIAELEELLTAFEASYPLADLHAIMELTPEEAPNHPIREPARIALVGIVAKWNALVETDISSQQHERLKEKYRVLSRAVGVINNNRVDHNR